MVNAELHEKEMSSTSRRQILGSFARGSSGDVSAALTGASMLRESASAASPSFVVRHVDVIALALLGRRSEALARLAQADPTNDPERCLTLARAYEALDARAEAIASYERVVALRGDAWDHLRLLRAGRALDARDIPPLAAGASNEERISYARALAKVFDAAGRFDETSIVLGDLFDAVTERPADLVLRAATLHLWRLEAEQARANGPGAVVVAGFLPRSAMVRSGFIIFPRPVVGENQSFVVDSDMAVGRD